MGAITQDLRYAQRQLRNSPGFTSVVILTLALGIGATTAIFSVVYGVLLRPLPYSDPNRIMAIFEVAPRGTLNRLADPNFDDFRDQNRSFRQMAKYSAYPAAVSGASQPTRSMVAHVSPDFLTVFRIQPAIGRDFTSADGKKGAAPVALVSHAYWTEYLGSSPDLSQLHLKIDNTDFSVIGVLPPAFRFPQGTDLWVAADRKGENPSRGSHNYDAVGRLREGVTVAQARAEISAIGRRIHDAASEQNDYLLKDATLVPLQNSMTGQARPALLVLLGAVGFLLLVACANVANLLLAQASAREHELAIRSALGAARGRLFRQFLTETSWLALMGGGLGVLGAFWGVSALLALAPEDLPLSGGVSVNMPVLLFAFLLSSSVALGLGAFTALRATSGNLRNELKEGGRGQAGSHTPMGRGIVATQVAITVVLVIGAGLLGRSLVKVLEVDPGFRVDKIVTMDVALPWPDWKDSQARAAQGIFFRSLLDRLKQIPSVRRVGAASGLPLDGGLPDGMFLRLRPEDVPKTPDSLNALTHLLDNLFRQKERFGYGEADFCAATPGYFQALGIPLLRGRSFDENDRPDSSHVAVISESLARDRWPGQEPIGHTIEFPIDGDLRLFTIVGIVGDVHEYGLDAPPRPTVYANLFQRPIPAVTVTMLTDANPQLVTSAARQILHELDPVVAPRFRTFSGIYAASLRSRRFNVILVGCFGMIALLLATVGVFGVMAYSVSRRTREIGVRVALGARSRDVLTMVLGQGLRTVLVGITIGIAGSLAITRTLESLLFGVTATDPATFAAVILLLVTTALLACYLPARRAAEIDPIVALRCE